MKLHCPRCEKKLNIPDKYAGKSIRCPACNKPFAVPKATVGVSGPGAGGAIDLEGLAALEARSTQLDEEELAAHHADTEAKKVAAAGKVAARTCPQCGKETKVKDPYADLICSHCWTPMSGLERGDGYDIGETKLVGYKGNVGKSSLGFYEGIGSSMAYPFQALGSLLLAVGIAIGVILFPVAMMTGVEAATRQSQVGTVEGVGAAELGGVQIFLRVIFFVEVLFFSAVGVHAFLDVVRTTAVGQEKPPTLVWNPGSWGSSIVGYVALVIYLTALTFLVLFIARGTTDPPLTLEAAAGVFSEKNVIIGMVMVAFIIPMNLIGLSLGSIGQALNPVNVVKSIGKTHVHYVFLVAVLCVYGTLAGVAFMSILKWFIPEVDKMVLETGTGNLGPVALGLLAWGVVMGFGFFAAYALGRIHGLFARSYRKKLLFGTE